MKLQRLFILPLLTSSLFAASIYVSPNGDDNNSGTSTNNPYKTPTFAVEQAHFGDTVFLMDGTYYNTSYGSGDYWSDDVTLLIDEKKNSVDDSYITVMPLNAGKVTLKGDGKFIIQVRQSDHIAIKGLKIIGETANIPISLGQDYQFTYKDSAGILHERVPKGSTPEEIEGMTDLPILSKEECIRPTYFNTSGISINNSNFVIIEDNIVKDAPGEGIRSFTSDYLTISGNEVTNCSRRSSTGVHGLSVYSAVSYDNADGYHIIISRNKVYDNYNEVYSWMQTKSFLTPHIDEGKGITIQRCYADKGWTNGRILIENNISYGNGFSGIHLNNGERVDIINNTVYGNNRTLRGKMHGISVQTGGDVTVANNIIVGDTTYNGNDTEYAPLALSAKTATPNLVIKNNLIVGNVTSTAKKARENAVEGSPMFVDTLNRNFTLMKESPAIGSADISMAPAVDFWGNQRDSSPDVGAIEYEGTTSIMGTVTLNSDISLIQNGNHLQLVNTQKFRTLSIYTLNGRKLLTQSIDGKSDIAINTGSLSMGSYIVELKGKSSITRKIVIR